MRTLTLRDLTGEYRAAVTGEGLVSVNGGPSIATVPAGPGEVRVGGAPGRLAWIAASGNTRWVFLDGEIFVFEVQPEGHRRPSEAVRGSLFAPMPATVVRVEVSVGDGVRRGDTLIILEAMKMELPVHAPADGTVTGIHCRAGDLVQPGIALIAIE